jgi:hypothetical protein
MAVIFGIGFFPIAGFIPPPSPAASAAEIALWYSDNLTGIRLGTVVMMFGVVLIAPWGVALAVHTARPRGACPSLPASRFFLLFDWSPFCLWVATFAVVIFRDRGERPVFPRWAGYLNLWVILLSLPGLLACYFVVGVFFVWLVVMTVLGIRATDRGAVMTGSTR